jgi:type IV fimbrial biogenesis protein FimT
LVRRMEGFSLVELMMVICVLALISAIATPSLLNWRNNAKLRGAASNLKGDMELARLKAIQVNDTVVVHFTENGYKVFKDDSGLTSGEYDAGEALYGDRTLPGGVKINLDKTGFGASGDSARFKGRGTAASGSAVLVNVKETEKKVTVSSLGRITITSQE